MLVYRDIMTSSPPVSEPDANISRPVLRVGRSPEPSMSTLGPRRRSPEVASVVRSGSASEAAEADAVGHRRLTRWHRFAEVRELQGLVPEWR